MGGWVGGGRRPPPGKFCFAGARVEEEFSVRLPCPAYVGLEGGGGGVPLRPPSSSSAVAVSRGAGGTAGSSGAVKGRLLEPQRARGRRQLPTVGWGAGSCGRASGGAAPLGGGGGGEQVGAGGGGLPSGTAAGRCRRSCLGQAVAGGQVRLHPVPGAWQELCVVAFSVAKQRVCVCVCVCASRQGNLQGIATLGIGWVVSTKGTVVLTRLKCLNFDLKWNVIAISNHSCLSVLQKETPHHRVLLVMHKTRIRLRKIYTEPTAVCIFKCSEEV